MLRQLRRHRPCETRSDRRSCRRTPRPISLRVVARVPDERDPAARAQDPRDLARARGLIEPVERLRDRHDVGRTRRRAGSTPRCPASGVAPGTAAASCASISGSGSTAVTRCPSATSERVSLPVPAPRSTTSRGSCAREPARRRRPDSRVASARRPRRRRAKDAALVLRSSLGSCPSRPRLPSPRASSSLVALLALAAVAAGCGGETTADPFAYEQGRRSSSTARRPSAVDGGARRPRSSRTRATPTGSRPTSSPLGGSGRRASRPSCYLHGAGGDRDEQLGLRDAPRPARRGRADDHGAVAGGRPRRRGSPPETAIRWQRDEIVADIVAARRALDLLAADERVDDDRLGARRLEHGRTTGDDGRRRRRPRPGDDAHVRPARRPSPSTSTPRRQSFRDDVEDVLPGDRPARLRRRHRRARCSSRRAAPTRSCPQQALAERRRRRARGARGRAGTRPITRSTSRRSATGSTGSSSSSGST